MTDFYCGRLPRGNFSLRSWDRSGEQKGSPMATLLKQQNGKLDNIGLMRLTTDRLSIFLER